MPSGWEKTRRLMEAARLYYEEDQTQMEIAKAFGISRPMVSKLLKEAKALGIVKIEIGSPSEGREAVVRRACQKFHLQGGLCLPKLDNDNTTNEALAAAAVDYLMGLKQKRMGVGWGTIIGKVAEVLERESAGRGMAQTVCPLIGNSSVSTKNYHSNELVRIFAQEVGALPAYLYAPAFIATAQEYGVILQMENYLEIQKKWDRLDVALVNIGNYPSVPDYASGARFGNILREKKAVGRFLTYFYNSKGEILQSETDYSVKIPLEKLVHTPHVIGICSANTKPAALAGALRTGIIGHIIAPEEVLEEAGGL